MDNKFLSKRILVAYAAALVLGTYFACAGIDNLFDILVGAKLPFQYAYVNSAVCVLAGSVLVGSARGLYNIYLHMISDKMHENHCSIKDLHMLPHICDSYVGIALILLVILETLGYRFFHFLDTEIMIVLHDPFELFFGPAALGVYGLYLVYRGNKRRNNTK